MESSEQNTSSILKSVLMRGTATDAMSNSTSCNSNESEIERNESESSKAKPSFCVDRTKITAIASEEQDSELQILGIDVYNQDDFEQGVMEQVDDALAAEEEMRLNMVLEKEMKAIQDDVRSCQEEVNNCEKVITELAPQALRNRDMKRRLKAVEMQKDNKLRQLQRLQGRQKALIQKTQRSLQAFEAEQEMRTQGRNSSLDQSLGLGSSRQETEAERMMRLGEMTPFGTIVGRQGEQQGAVSDFEKYLMDQQTKLSSHKSSKSSKSKKKMKRSHSDLPKQINKSKSSVKEDSTEPSVKHMKKSKSTSLVSNANGSSPSKKKETNYFDSRDRKVYRPSERDFSNYQGSKTKFNLRHNFNGPGESRPDYDPEEEYTSDGNDRDADYRPSMSEDENDSEDAEQNITVKGRKNEWDVGVIKEKYTGKKMKKTLSSSSVRSVGSVRDDGSEEQYYRRIGQWKRTELQKKQQRIMRGEIESEEESDMEFEGGFKVPGKIWKKLYRYQKTGVKWLWELHLQQCGGIIGDEMGLGKTIQMIAFLVGLNFSKLRDKGANVKYVGLGPTIIACPATVMHQWVKEFNTWWPMFRVAVLHNTGSYSSSEKDLIRDIVLNCGIIITSYSSLVIHQELLLRYDWHYIILDEGHKIRNPDAQATLACKQFRTCHRIILTGSPMQNNLKELWSLFDFVFPGKLGTLPDFMAHFSVPIVQGGYSNATQVQVQTAYKCACVLRDTINPYLIRRMKADVKTSLNLPQKNEQVLFCRLTDHQREVYQEYLDSKECAQILRGNYMVFPGLITLRKICNHADLSTGGPRLFDPDIMTGDEEELQYGFYQRSGKMIVVESLLKLWKKQKHKVLIFTQGQKMLDILETFVQKQGYQYLRMDGCTGISSRQPLIRKFNESPELFLFLLTTRVGGLGVNLTGADRVIIFDPDWNPSTDTQARERAWRIGQEKQVTIYRLVTTGTIEEKIYHRQIFKQFLSNRVLKDPKQRRFFKSNDLFELFMLGTDDPTIGTETSAIFAGTGSDVKVKLKEKKDTEEKKKRKNRFDLLRAKKEVKQEEEDPDMDTSGNNEGEIDFDKDKLDRMRELAKKLSIQFVEKSGEKRKSEKSDPSLTRSDSSDGGNDVVIKVETDTVGDSTKDNASKYSEAQDSIPSTSSTDKQIKVETVKESSSHKKESSEEERRKRRKEKDRKRRKEEERRKRKEQEKKKKKKRKKDAVFEGERIDHLDRCKPYLKPDSEEEDSKTSDDYVLQKLFQKNDGIHSAIQHDSIMQSSLPDYALVEGEADRVAKEAARALRRSRAQCYTAQSGMPTWTGQSGVSKPRFGQKKNPKLMSDLTKEEKEKIVKKVTTPPKVDTLFAPDPIVKHFDGSIAGNMKTTSQLSASATPNLMSSDELLQRMRSRNYLTENTQGVQGAENSGDEDDPDNPWAGSVSLNTNPEYVELITDIRNHIAFGCSIDGQASTDELLEHFQPRLPPKDSAKFKAMAKQICDFEKRDGVGIWRLKQHFR